MKNKNIIDFKISFKSSDSFNYYFKKEYIEISTYLKNKYNNNNSDIIQKVSNFFFLGEK